VLDCIRVSAVAFSTYLRYNGCMMNRKFEAGDRVRSLSDGREYVVRAVSQGNKVCIRDINLGWEQAAHVAELVKL